jgi:hypothetical protein
VAVCGWTVGCGQTASGLDGNVNRQVGCVAQGVAQGQEEINNGEERKPLRIAWLKSLVFIHSKMRLSV